MYNRPAIAGFRGMREWSEKRQPASLAISSSPPPPLLRKNLSFGFFDINSSRAGKECLALEGSRAKRIAGGIMHIRGGYRCFEATIYNIQPWFMHIYGLLRAGIGRSGGRVTSRCGSSYIDVYIFRSQGRELDLALWGLCIHVDVRWYPSD